MTTRWQRGQWDFLKNFDGVLNKMLLLACVKGLHAMVWAVSCTNVG